MPLFRDFEPLRRRSLTDRFRTAIGLVLLAVFIAWNGSNALASSVGAVVEDASTLAEPHSCPCGMNCKGECCCAPKKSKAAGKASARPTASTSPIGRIARRSGVCISPSPCGGAIPPETLRRLILGDASWTACKADRPSLPVALRSEVEASAWTAPMSSRIDEPPEILA